MTNVYLKLVGNFSSIFGKIDKYTSEHTKFLKSGYVCQNCKKTLMNWWGVADVKCFNNDGQELSLMKARTIGAYFECPKCNYQWKIQDIPLSSVEEKNQIKGHKN